MSEFLTVQHRPAGVEAGGGEGWDGGDLRGAALVRRNDPLLVAVSWKRKAGSGLMAM